MKLKSRIQNIKQEDIEYISNKYKLPFEISKLILSRTKLNNVESFLFPDVNSLFSPFLISNMKKVVEKINYIKANKLKLVVFGDYDVDGITATSLFYNFFKEEDIDVNFYIPSRSNGYGLTEKSINEVIEIYNPDVIFTVDCGITSYKEVEYIKSKNIDIVITDHHTPQEILPNCLIINPHLENLEFKDLCGVGVAFKIVQAYYNLKKEFYIKYLPIVAIGTIADVVPLIMDNRIMVQIGFSVATFLPKGIKKLLSYIDVNISDLNSQIIAYKIAPLLNSVGRLKNADIAVKLFILDDDEELDKICLEIIETNKIRQAITEEIFLDAEKKILKNKIPSVIILQNPNWDAGIIGIVASKILEKYKRTTILFTESQGMLKGSCRSIEGINIFNELSKAEKYIIQFGGHEKAAGLTIKKEEFDNFKNELTKNIGISMKDVDIVSYYDTEILAQEVDLNFAKKLSILEPFGECNPSPVFLLKTFMPEIEYMKKNDRHIVVKYQNLKIKYFNADKQILNYKYFVNSLNLVKISTSLFNGYEFLNIICENAIFSKLNANISTHSIEKNRLKCLLGNLDFSPSPICNIEQIKDKDNFIICTYNKNNFEKLQNYFKDSVTYTIGSVIMAEKRKNVCFCLENLTEILNFENVYFVEKKFSNFVKCNNKALIDFNFNDFDNININRDKLINCFLAIKNYIIRETCFEDNIKKIENFDAEDIYLYLKKIYYNLNLTFNEFMLALLILEELKIVEYKKGSLLLNDSIKCDLNNSKLFRFNI